MKILLLTAGDRVSSSGLYRSQTLDIAQSLKDFCESVSILSLVPIINTDSIAKGIRYIKYIKSVIHSCRASGFLLVVILLPFSSHSQFIGKAIWLILWDNPLILWLIRAKLARLSPDVVSCRGLLAAYLVCKAVPPTGSIVINYDLRGNSKVEAALLCGSSDVSKNRIAKLEEFVLSRCNSVTAVSDILADQCNVPPEKRFITRISSSMPLASENIPTFYPQQSQTFFLTIGSISKSWYPLSEFRKVTQGIQRYVPGSANIVLAPKSCHHVILKDSEYSSFRIAELSSFVDTNQAAKAASRCLFGLLPHRKPREYETDLIDLAATVMSTKLSDYISLGVVPLVPKWCTAAANFVAYHKVGFVYDASYSFEFLADPGISELISQYRSNLIKIRNQFTSQSIASNYAELFAQLIKC